ncbi:MAG: acyl-CoA dehydrogenase [Myxococcales bacterium]|nr:acyl-CoA dehydrogenase [Myxococcota bacterium]MDW8283541.1 acyl-CoA dehydrogenase [Myxococcales bacterium]
MAHAQNRYLADLRDVHFLLFEQFRLGELLADPVFGGMDEATARMIVAESYDFARQVLGPLNEVGDREGCRLEGGAVRTPSGFRDAWQKLYEAGWKTLRVSPDHGGQGAPALLTVMVEEFLSGANTAFNMYPGLALGAAEVIAEYGTPEQKRAYLEPMYHGTFGGTMCLTEPHAGSDVGAARTRAEPRPDGTFLISGTKSFISGGDHDLAQNIVHLVLARVDGSPPGTKGLSLFIVPKLRLDGTPNDVVVAGLEHKMGIHGSATCLLNFGENGGCIGELLGGPPGLNQGIRQMFQLMNSARISVGIQGLAVASSAYLNALRYARERKQGPSIRHFKDPTAPRVPILQHADVRRMLLDMKARVEGIRALVAKLARHMDLARLSQGKDDQAHAYHLGQVELLTPIVKAYGSDQGFRVCEMAIQTLGGAGYIRDYGIEQYCRDAKIFSIYEGTNHIQAMDLVGRKLGLAGGAHLQRFLGDIGSFTRAQAGHPVLGPSVAVLGRAAEAVASTTLRLLDWFQGGRLEQVPLVANRFLEMMGETAVGWLLLEQASLALARLQELPPTHPDRSFYEGKRYAAVYFAQNVLPGVEDKARVLASEDRSALDIPDAAFAQV